MLKNIFTKKLCVLLVENNPADVLVTKLIFNESGNKEVFVVSDGEAALLFLRKEGEYADRPFPDLTVLDLNMPRMDGRMFLKEIKKDARFKNIPVIIFTCSGLEKDASDSAAMGVHYYVRKPIDLDDFASAVESIDYFWLNHILPKSVHRN